MLTRERILDLFAELNDELCAGGIRGDVFIVGGAAIPLAYDARPATRDVDAIWRPSSDVRQAVARVARRHDDLPEDWLNDGVKAFLPGDDHGERRVVYENDCLTVSAASPEYLLATKLLASRVGRDEDDIRRLYGLCGFSTVDQGLDLLERYYPGRPMEAKGAVLARGPAGRRRRLTAPARRGRTDLPPAAPPGRTTGDRQGP